MKDLLIQLDDHAFVVKIKRNGFFNTNKSWEGSVYETENVTNNGGELLFVSANDSNYTKDIKNARCWFNWSFCYRGVWEGRVYFKDEEYWSEELSVIPLIWEKIKDIMINKIKQDNPDYKFHDDD
jgi:hypothetical protein